MIDIEEWRSVHGYEGLYEVSSNGRVRSLPRSRLTAVGMQRWPGKELRAFVDDTGYLYVNLSNGSKAKKRAVHSLVLEAFIGPRPDGMQACHRDGNRVNPALENLRWDSVKANAMDRVTHGTQVRGSRSGVARLSDESVREILSRSESSKVLAKEYGVASSTIRAIRIGQNWRHMKTSVALVERGLLEVT